MKDHDDAAPGTTGPFAKGLAMKQGLQRLWVAVLTLMLALPLQVRASELAFRLTAGLVSDPQESPVQVLDAERTRLKAAPNQHYFNVPHTAAGAWLKLTPPPGGWPRDELVFSLPGLPQGQLQAWLIPPGDAPQPVGRDWIGHGRRALMLGEVPPDASLLVRVDRQRLALAPLLARVQPLADYQRSDAVWLAFATLCLAALVLTALVAGLFAVQLRDSAYASYLGYALSYALVQALQTGYAREPLQLDRLGMDLVVIGRGATAASVCFAILFIDRFVDLRRYTPRLRPLLIAPTVLILLLAVLSLIPATADLPYGSLINPLLLLGALLVPMIAALACWRGSRYAAYFLIGWVPLMAVTALGSAQADGAFAGWTWLIDAGLGAGALEAVLLSLGLVDRTLSVRHERDHALQLAERDGLTGLLNRRAWLYKLSIIVNETPATDPHCAVLFIDLDHFKSLNDRLGHDAGDQALSAVANVLRRTLRPIDSVARYGGEEFVAALPGCGLAEAQRIAERVRNGIRDLGLRCGEDGPRLTASIGIAQASHGCDLTQLMARADQAMYQAKAEGRDRVVAAAAFRLETRASQA